MGKSIGELIFEADRIVVEECYKQRSKCRQCKYNNPTELYANICDAVTFIALGIELRNYNKTK